MWWLILFFLGLMVDLIEGSRLGQTSLMLLLIGLIIGLVKKWLPQKSSTVKLKH